MAISKIILNGVTQMDLTADTVADASHIRQGYVGHLNDGTSATGSYAGGASNIVTGTFKGTTTGAAMDVTLNYSGSGYPIAVMIYPSRSDVSTFNSLLQRYAIREYCADKMTNDEPSYDADGNINSGYVCTKYKNSASTSTVYNTGGGTGTHNVYRDTDATASSTLAVRIRSKTKMSVFIASTSYGFAANIEYAYCIIYSS